jgi:hypothetical protein
MKPVTSLPPVSAIVAYTLGFHMTSHGELTDLIVELRNCSRDRATEIADDLMRSPAHFILQAQDHTTRDALLSHCIQIGMTALKSHID